MEPPREFLDALAAEGIDPSAEQLDLLAGYLAALLEANRSSNLTAVRDPGEAWHRHVLESLALARFLDGRDAVADIGSGGGLPGIPLAIVAPGRRFTLIEATGKKARFLERTARALKLENVSVLNARAEDAGRDPDRRGAFEAAVSRAVGSLAELVELALPLLREGGALYAVKGRSARRELEAASRALELLGGEAGAIEPLLGSGGDSAVIEVRKVRPTPEAYPRRPGMPRKRPL